jgi:hypothetical protein
MQSNILENLEAIQHVGEVVRLFVIFKQKGKPRIEEQALIAACKQKAGISSRYPKPEPALSLALAAGLMNRRGGFVSLTDIGRIFLTKGTGISLEISREQGRLLLAAMLDDSAVEEKIRALLKTFQIVGGKPLTRRNAVIQMPERLLLCRILQQMGVFEISGDYYLVVSPFDSILDRLIIRAVKLSQKELWERLERQRQRGEMAEQIVVDIEIRRLKKLNRADLASRVQWISPTNVSAGYDVLSFEKNGTPRLIEVKSSVGSKVSFEWSENERERAEKEGSAYFVYFVPSAYSLPALVSPVITIKNPRQIIADGKLLESPSSYRVTETSGIFRPKQDGLDSEIVQFS